MLPNINFYSGKNILQVSLVDRPLSRPKTKIDEKKNE